MVLLCVERNEAVTLQPECIWRRISNRHSITHMWVSCSKILAFDYAISVVVSIVNYSRSRRLNHRVFKSFLEKAGAEYADLVYHAEVRRLSQAKIIQGSRFF